jgi:hypothetical protein
VSTILWTALFVALETRATGVVNSELRAGSAPASAGARSEATVVSTTTPSLVLYMFDRTRTGSVSYSPRFLFREPNGQDELRPVIFHQAALNGTQRFSRFAVGRVGVTGGLGELDYTGLQQSLGNNAGLNVPRTNKIAQGTAYGELTNKLDDQWSLFSDVRASLFSPRTGVTSMPSVVEASAPAQVNNLIARQTTVDVGSSVSTQIAASGNLAAGLRAASYSSSNGVSLFVLSPAISFTNVIDGGTGELRLAAGVAIVRDLNDDVVGHRSQSRLLPTSGVSVVNQLSNSKAMRLWSDVGCSSSFFVDPVYGRARLRGQANAALRAMFSRQWNARFELVFSTSLMKHPMIQRDLSVPVMDTAVAQYPFETQLILTIPLRWQPTPDFSMEGGVRVAKRGPHLAAPGFSLAERESWVYVAATVGFDLTGGRPATVPH